MHGLSSESRMFVTKHRTKKFRVFGRCLCAVRLVLRHDSGSVSLYMIMGSGAEEHVISHAEWRNWGELSLRHTQVRLRSVTGDDTEVIGSISVRGWCGELTILVATRATRSLCSASKLLRLGYEVEMKPTRSALRHRGGGNVLVRRSGNPCGENK